MPMRQAMAEISLTDDTSHSYDLSAVRAGWGRSRDRQEWHGRVLAAQDPARSLPGSSYTRDGAIGRFVLPPPAQVPVGRLPRCGRPGGVLPGRARAVTHISMEASPSGQFG